MWLQLSQQVSAEGGGLRGAAGAVPESHRDLRAGQEPNPMGIAPLPKEQGSGVGKTARIMELFGLEKLSEVRVPLFPPHGQVSPSATSMIFSVSRKRLGEIRKNSPLNYLQLPLAENSLLDLSTLPFVGYFTCEYQQCCLVLPEG